MEEKNNLNNMNQNEQQQAFRPQPIPDKPKVPFYKKWWFWVIVVVLVLGIIGGGTAGSKGKNDDSSSKDNSSSAVQADVDVTEAVTEAPTEAVTEAPTESREEYIANCVEVAYKDLARTPDQYKGQKVKVKIEISQVMNGGWLTDSGYRGYEDYDLDFENPDSTYLEKEWYISYEIAEGEPKILENDVVYFYGEYAGTEEMKRALTGSTDYVPKLNAVYHDIISG